MATSPQSRGSKPFLMFLFFVLAGIVGTYLWRHKSKPLGEPPRINSSSVEMSDADKQRFLEGDFLIVKKMKALPSPIVQVFTEEGGSRLVIADPGQRFEATDVISDASLPGRRLIFAGIQGDKCFIHYEQGGIGHMFIVAFFRVKSKHDIERLSRFYCGPARDLLDLRSQVARGDCSDPVPQEMR